MSEAPTKSAQEQLADVIRQGQEQLQKMQQDNEKMFQQSILQMQGANEATVRVSDVLDEDLVEAFNAYSGQPLQQQVIMGIQQLRYQKNIFLFVQAIGAHLAKVDAPETQAATAAAGG